jgi:S1-C subfamily serine protease
MNPSRGDTLDIVLLVIAALLALRGYRRGLVYSILTSVGFLAGAYVGSKLAPGLVTAVAQRSANDSAADKAVLQRVLTIVIVLVLAVLGEYLAARAARALRSAMSLTPLRAVDGVGGALLSAGSFLLVAWLVGTALGSAPYRQVVSQIRRSEVLSVVNGLIPAAGRAHFSALLRSVQSQSFPPLFDPLGQIPQLLAAVPAPDAGVVPGALRASGPSVVKIVGQAPECSVQSEGSGFVYAAEHVMTNAHVVAGVRTLTVTTPGPDSRTLAARVVLFDPHRDVAVLYVPGLESKALDFDRVGSRSDSAVVAGYPENGPFRAGAARISSRAPVTGPDIYQGSSVTRDVYTLRAQVQPGNSGGPLLSPSGRVYGVVFARSTDTPDVGYALTADEVASDAAAGRTTTAATSTQRCD